MKLQLFSRRTIWWPTWLGWSCLLLLIGSGVGWWFLAGEAFLAQTQRVLAKVLVVEAWIGRDGMQAAKEEFEAGKYEWLIAAGGYTGEGWMERRWSYAQMAEKELLRLGVPRDRLLAAQARETDAQRTYESALATMAVLEKHGLEGAAVNVFTRGPHSRRSRLVFAKVLGSKTLVGTISWSLPESQVGSWWRSSDRAKELVTETAGYWFEALAGSGRWAKRSVSAAP
jgi:uncharacterized SAM-binding protein YcdF (DUF218 family)